MQFQETSDGIIVVLGRGEKIVEQLGELVQAHEIPSGTITGLGAVMNTRLGFYHLPKKKYDERTIPEEVELVSLIGNITWFENKPVVHVHATIGTTDFRAMAGHLFEAQVAVTVEIFVSVKDVRVQRKFNPEMGLNLQCLLGTHS